MKKIPKTCFYSTSRFGFCFQEKLIESVLRLVCEHNDVRIKFIAFNEYYYTKKVLESTQFIQL